MKYAFSTAAALLATFSLTLAADAPTCSPTQKCPDSAPCCSQYGQCGVGAYCLGGCDPESSFDLQSCVAAPTCKSGDFKLDSLDDVAANTVYLGDASKANWVSSGKPVTYNGDSILLTMAPSTVGTLLSSTHYVWYGKISATMTTSQGQGVVTAFILMSDVKDEIDFEFVGDDVTHAQSNYYWQGVTDYHNMVPLDTSDTRSNTHTYTIDWTPDQVTWSIDGNSMRTLKKSDTWNSSTNSYHFPQTPARVQLSLWPAGLESNGEGTVSWAGGLVNWDSQYMQNGYYYAMVNDVSIECYDPPDGYTNNGDKSYYYMDTLGTNSSVAIGNNDTILSSFMATGDNPSFDPNAKPSGTSSSKTNSATSSSASISATPESVPGISGGGNMASSNGAPAGDANGNTGTGSSGSSGSGSGSGTDSSAASQSSASSGSSGFSQGGSSSGSGSGSSSDAPKIVAGSAVALLGFFVAALMI
ncbi:glycoside hydrolase family 16 protein [Zasmidium cellare ATCC 36951]|uniref:Crh-like protein n=1 Tax=Zasmidium cellare ATCC 36951 TaxID=1080233 RepID=A0A6A6CPI7_ZASCE|nr:glycoside hydrolase family 16 protein [Zasmidium cellare ATCC 36951]KAF2168583.1 glycoside hydrolase family 16 protein [Zasmidium cellare ATCC 36951]